ncbi:MAG: hypothetical protein IPP74_06865 [Alphaproteobacteria bacterium]|nr:hypothetical protein [Alphaproteobacteria bacterium]
MKEARALTNDLMQNGVSKDGVSNEVRDQISAMGLTDRLALYLALKDYAPNDPKAIALRLAVTSTFSDNQISGFYDAQGKKRLLCKTSG